MMKWDSLPLAVIKCECTARGLEDYITECERIGPVIALDAIGCSILNRKSNYKHLA